ncbi:MAG: hypothetical protein ACRDRH_21170 [Pseudonocardia sp.]
MGAGIAYDPGRGDPVPRRVARLDRRTDARPARSQRPERRSPESSAVLRDLSISLDNVAGIQDRRGVGGFYHRAMSRPTRDELRKWSANLKPDEPLDVADPNEMRYVALAEAGRGAVDDMQATIELALESTTHASHRPLRLGKDDRAVSAAPRPHESRIPGHGRRHHRLHQ